MADGGFERKYLNGGFGGRDRTYSQVDVSLDTSQFHSGTRALRVRFIGPGLSDTTLGSISKSEDIASASGSRLVIQDFYNNNQMLVSTDDLLGTSGWQELVADFVTGPQTRLVTVRIMRVPGNPLIKGTFWLDDVQLAVVPTAENSH